jgi:hypothetical protein
MKTTTLREEMVDAAGQVIAQTPVPTLTELALQLAMIESRRNSLMAMLDYRAKEISKPVEEDQYQMLIEFAALQAAKRGMESDDLFMELQYRFGLADMRQLPAEKIWEAMTFVKNFQ